MASEANSFNFDTGFPEPFCRLRNTTLRHPDAKSGDEAFLGFDVTFESRRRQSSTKHKHALNWGSLDAKDTSAAAFEPGLSPTMGLRRLSRARALTSVSRLASFSSTVPPGDLTDQPASPHFRADSVESSDTSPEDPDTQPRPGILKRKRTVFNVIRRKPGRRQTAGTQNSESE